MSKNAKVVQNIKYRFEYSFMGGGLTGLLGGGKTEVLGEGQIFGGQHQKNFTLRGGTKTVLQRGKSKKKTNMNMLKKMRFFISMFIGNISKIRLL